MKLIAMTVSAMAMPGKNGHHQFPTDIVFCEMGSALPQLMSWAFGAEVQERLTKASRMIAWPRAAWPTR